MLDSQQNTALSAPQIKVGVAPGMQFGRTAQRLSASRIGALAGMVDEDDSGVEVALQVAETG